MQIISDARYVLKVLWRHPLEVVLSSLLLGMTVVAFTQVVFRYVLHAPLSWSEELARFLLMWFGMLGAAYAFKTKSHFALEFLVKRCGGYLRRAIVVFTLVASSAFLIVFILKSFDLIRDAATQIAPGTQLPMAVPYSSAAVGGTLILYYVLRNGWSELRRHRATSDPR